MLPATLTVPAGTTVTFAMSPKSFEVHTATFGPGNPETEPTSYLGKIAASFEGAAARPEAACTRASSRRRVATLSPTLHGNGFWNSGVMDDAPPRRRPASNTVTFDTPGTYDYYCLIHPFMHGQIIVTVRRRAVVLALRDGSGGIGRRSRSGGGQALLGRGGAGDLERRAQPARRDHGHDVSAVARRCSRRSSTGATRRTGSAAANQPQGDGNQDLMPGPLLRARVGDRLRIHFKNMDTTFKRPHSMHFHGVDYKPSSDGAYLPGFSGRDANVKPGRTSPTS